MVIQYGKQPEWVGVSQGGRLELLDADERRGRMVLRIVDLVMVLEGKAF